MYTICYIRIKKTLYTDVGWMSEKRGWKDDERASERAGTEKWFRFVAKVITISLYRHRRHQDNIIARGEKMYVSVHDRTGANYGVYKSTFSIMRRAESRCGIFLHFIFVIYYPGLYVSKRENRLSTVKFISPRLVCILCRFFTSFSLCFTPLLS